MYHATMSSSPTRRPSTLAARKFEAAQRPIGATPDPRLSARPESGPMMGVGRSSVANAPSVPARLVSAVPMRTRPVAPTPAPFATTVRGAAKPVAERAPQSAPSTPAPVIQRRIATERAESVLITSLVVAFVFVAIAIATVRVSGGMKQERSRKQLTTTFSRVFEQQGNYRLITGRFATWTELQKRGTKLSPEQRVVGSNASASHWFLAVRDTTTGITCSRTGELFDEGPTSRTPTCSGGAR
jgi:hypothetical protein